MASKKKEQKSKYDNPLKNLKWERFCNLFVQKNDDDTYNNATRSYAIAFDHDIDGARDDDAVWGDKKNPENGLTYRVKLKKSSKELKENTCAVEGRRLLRTTQIQNRIKELHLIAFHDDDDADNEGPCAATSRTSFNNATTSNGITTTTTSSETKMITRVRRNEWN